eukprot:m.600349 g.600349  ORF g.600349 m.600349 type:complete len:1056 (+) comp22431_c0_seq2:277-3444(+)
MIENSVRTTVLLFAALALSLGPVTIISATSAAAPETIEIIGWDVHEIASTSDLGVTVNVSYTTDVTVSPANLRTLIKTSTSSNLDSIYVVLRTSPSITSVYFELDYAETAAHEALGAFSIIAYITPPGTKRWADRVSDDRVEDVSLLGALSSTMPAAVLSSSTTVDTTTISYTTASTYTSTTTLSTTSSISSTSSTQSQTTTITHTTVSAISSTITSATFTVTTPTTSTERTSVTVTEPSSTISTSSSSTSGTVFTEAPSSTTARSTSTVSETTGQRQYTSTSTTSSIVSSHMSSTQMSTSTLSSSSSSLLNTTEHPVSTSTTASETQTTTTSPAPGCFDFAGSRACRDFKILENACEATSLYFSFMEKNCNETCGLCDVSTELPGSTVAPESTPIPDFSSYCEDSDDACAVYSAAGHCDASHALFVLTVMRCPRTCGLCASTFVPPLLEGTICEDYHAYRDVEQRRCSDWSSQSCFSARAFGYSTNDARDLLLNCPVSCKICAASADKMPFSSTLGGAVEAESAGAHRISTSNSVSTSVVVLVAIVGTLVVGIAVYLGIYHRRQRQSILLGRHRKHVEGPLHDPEPRRPASHPPTPPNGVPPPMYHTPEPLAQTHGGDARPTRASVESIAAREREDAVARYLQQRHPTTESAVTYDNMPLGDMAYSAQSPGGVLSRNSMLQLYQSVEEKMAQLEQNPAADKTARALEKVMNQGRTIDDTAYDSDGSASGYVKPRASMLVAAAPTYALARNDTDGDGDDDADDCNHKGNAATYDIGSSERYKAPVYDVAMDRRHVKGNTAIIRGIPETAETPSQQHMQENAVTTQPSPLSVGSSVLRLQHMDTGSGADTEDGEDDVYALASKIGDTPAAVSTTLTPPMPVNSGLAPKDIADVETDSATEAMQRRNDPGITREIDVDTIPTPEKVTSELHTTAHSTGSEALTENTKYATITIAPTMGRKLIGRSSSATSDTATSDVGSVLEYVSIADGIDEIIPEQDSDEDDGPPKASTLVLMPTSTSHATCTLARVSGESEAVEDNTHDASDTHGRRTSSTDADA